MLIIKIGGGKDINWGGVSRDIAELRKTESIILVHGASIARNELADRLGVPVRIVESPKGIPSVYTDREAMDIFLMAYAGLANKRIVERLLTQGIPAVGLTGVDGGLWRARRKPDLLSKSNGRTKLLSGNFTGKVDEVNTSLIRHLLDGGYLPVVCAPAISHNHEIVNTDNDIAAAFMAGVLGCRRMVWLFEAPGLLREADNPESCIPYISRYEIQEFIDCARGRMKKKIMGAQLAIELGVESIYWGDGRIDHPIVSALDGQGTIIG